jgi:hypothetical protein
VAVNARQPVFKTDHFDVIIRAPRWFDQIAPGIADNSTERLRTLRPAWALADQLKDAGWERGGLSPDDIEWSQISRADERDWRAACEVLGLARIALLDMAVSPRGHQRRDAGKTSQSRARRL